MENYLSRSPGGINKRQKIKQKLNVNQYWGSETLTVSDKIMKTPCEYPEFKLRVFNLRGVQIFMSFAFRALPGSHSEDWRKICLKKEGKNHYY